MISSVAIIGMGALGLMYASRMSASGEISPIFVMDEEHMRRTEGHAFEVNGRPVAFERRLSADMQPVDLVMVATKMTALEAAIELMGTCVDEHTVIVSVCNGITSEEKIGARFRMQRVIPCVAQGMDAVKLGDSLKFSSEGVLIIGTLPVTDSAAFEELKGFFDRTGVSYIADEDIMLRMWKKFMLNCGINQSCMVYSSTYGKAVRPELPEYRCFVDAMQEVRLLAAAEGYEITQADIDYYIQLMASLDPDGMPSMAQDRISHRPSEVDTFAGTVLRLAGRHGIDVPVNRFIYDEVKRIEAEY